MASTPAMNVVATAPIPGVRMPSLPVAGLISVFTVGDMRGSFYYANGSVSKTATPVP